jgi:radical SAM protein with 4Fe4S-binding SPASM domain
MNMHEKLSRLQNCMNNTKGLPFAIDINPTYRCNLSCKFCNGFLEGVTRSRKEELTDPEFMDCLSQAIKLDAKEFHIAGDGEPLIKKKLVLGMASYIKKYKGTGRITTNGTLIDRQTAEKLVLLDWDILNLSIEGSCATIHDSLVGFKGAFDRVLYAIHHINDQKKKMHKKHPEIRITTVICKDNFHDLKNIIALAKRLGIKYTHFEPLEICEPGVTRAQITKRQHTDARSFFAESAALATADHIYTNIKDMDLFYDQKITNSQPIQDESPKQFCPVCFQPWLKMVIRPNGQTQPCCNLYDTQAENVRNKSLHDIWHGLFFNKMRDELLHHRLHDDCSRCNAWIFDENLKLRSILNERSKIRRSMLYLFQRGKEHIPTDIKDLFYFKIKPWLSK